ncbi:arginase family protein [Flavobacteriaceae bacterium M23B6Z8]
MNIYFPQWQGSGDGISIKEGAATILDFLGSTNFVQIPLAETTENKDTQVAHQESLYKQLTDFRKTLKKEKPTTLHTVGGDCGLEIIPVSYLNKKHDGNLAVIWFDAHGDIHSADSSPSKHFHGMPLRTLLGEGPENFNELLFATLHPSQIFYVGVRDLETEEIDFIEEQEIYRHQEDTFDALIAEIKERQLTRIYIHFDVDVLDPEAYGHAFFKVANGLTTEECEEGISKLLTHFTLAGSSLLESVGQNEKELEPIKGIIDLILP